MNKKWLYGIVPLGAIPQLFPPQNGVITELVTDEQTRENIKDQVKEHTISGMLGIKDKIAEMAEEMHQNALLTPDPNDDKIDFLKYMHDYVGAAPITHFLPDWCKDIIIYVLSSITNFGHNVIEGLFKVIYKLITEVVVWTPEWLFSDGWFPEFVNKFSSISIIIVVIFSMIEGLKKIFKMSHTPFRETLTKLPIALLVSAAAPYLFLHGTRLLNKLTQAILNLGADASAKLGANAIFALPVVFEPLNFILIFCFIILLFFLMFPMLLHHGRRWFNFLVCGALTPLAMSSWLFRSTEQYFYMWLNSIKNMTLGQLGYSVFVSILGLFIFGTPNPTTFAGLATKSLIMIGGLVSLSFPPHFLNRFMHKGESLTGWYRDMKNHTSNTVNSVKETKENTEKGLVGAARIAGIIYRFLSPKG